MCDKCSRNESSHNLSFKVHEISGTGEVKFAGDSLCTTSFEIRKARGNFVEGKLEGEGVITFLDGSLLKGTFHRGVLHGLCRKFWCRFGPCDLFEKKEWTIPKYLWEVRNNLNRSTGRTSFNLSPFTKPLAK